MYNSHEASVIFDVIMFCDPAPVFYIAASLDAFRSFVAALQSPLALTKDMLVDAMYLLDVQEIQRASLCSPLGQN